MSKSPITILSFFSFPHSFPKILPYVIMAGVRHHILPSFLLKGFASRIQDSGVFTFLYRKHKTPFETNIINVGAEKHFYGEKGKISADDVINEAIARRSYEYFICSSHSHEFLKLHAIIGKDAAILSNDELKQIAYELMRS